MMESTSRPNPRRLRAKLLIAGHTLTSFAAKHRLSYNTVKAAVHGRRSGIKSQLVLRKIEAL